MHISRFVIDRMVDNKRPDGHPCHMLLPFNLNGEFNIEVMQCSCLTESAGCCIMKITHDGSGYDESQIIGNSSHMMGECSISKVRKDTYLATVMNNNCKLAKIMSESGCFLTSAIPYNDHEIEWTVMGSNKMFIKNLIARLRNEGYGLKTLSLELLDADVLLTPKQEEVVRYAHNNGYYESPKKINIDNLCEIFDCSKSTMSVLLKSAEKKLIGSFLNVNRSKRC